jgi:hypothetical protein
VGIAMGDLDQALAIASKTYQVGARTQPMRDATIPLLAADLRHYPDEASNVPRRGDAEITCPDDSLRA